MKKTVNEFSNAQIVALYKEYIMDMVKLTYPELHNTEIMQSIEYSINKRAKNYEASLSNDYKNKDLQTTLLQLTEYIIETKPIITALGVLYNPRSKAENPVSAMMQTFLKQRKIYKKEMFKHPKGSEEFEKYNLLQLLSKIDANSLNNRRGLSIAI